MLQAAIDKCSANVNGTVRVKLYKETSTSSGGRRRVDCTTPTLSTFEDDGGAYDQKDAAGFIKDPGAQAQDARHAGGPPDM